MGTDDWVQRVQQVAPLVERYRDDSERQRRLAQPLFEALRDAGLFGLWVPRSLGGAEVDVETSVRVVEELSRLDGAVGWNVMIAANTSILWANLESGAAADMVADAGSVIAGTVTSGSGTAVPVTGGYRLSGQWPFASGCHHADWLVCVGQIVDGGEARRAADGSPQTYTFVVPARDCEILDTWHTVGLRGTGSHDFRADDLFVPEARHFLSRGARSFQSGPLYNTSFYHLWGPNIAAVALGIGRAAIDAFVALAASKRSARNPTALAERETVQEKVGRAEALLRSGRAFLYETIRSTWAVAASRPPTRPLIGTKVPNLLSTGKPRPGPVDAVPEELTALNRLAAATAVDNAIAAVDLVFTLGGTSSIYAGKRIERCFRDVHVVRQHAVVAPAATANAGRYFLGLGLAR